VCLPGFIDAHDHLANLAVTKAGISLAGIGAPDVMLERIRDYAASRTDDAVIRGF
jgi:predicted amidohydrolase YtcJ